MTTEVQLELDESIKRRFGTVADDARVTRTAAALEANGIRVLRAANAAEAKRIVLESHPGWIASSQWRVAIARGIGNHR